MKRLFLILLSLLLFVGCDTGVIDIYFPPDPSYSTCPDYTAENYNYFDCSPGYSEYDPSNCPWKTNDGCEYCVDNYETEEERLENCCHIPTATNFAFGGWGEWNGNSADSSYCIFE